jgi:cytochrome c oxidase assembly protein subunit 11
MSEEIPSHAAPTEAPHAAPRAPVASAGRHRLVGLACAAFVVAMVGAAYAAVPLYQMLCQVTGFAGTTRVATKAPEKELARTVQVRFDSNVAPGLAWNFQPDVGSVQVRLGETKLAYFRVTNRGSTPTTGTATYNVTPGAVGSYFNKLQCFCFTEQTLKPGESVEMPVVFFVDPSMADDSEMAGVKSITLSYTFFAKAATTPAPVASGEAASTPPAKAPL